MISSAFRFGAVLTIALIAAGCAEKGFDELNAASEFDDNESVGESQQALIWDSLGGGLTSGPGVSSWAPGRLDVFVRGTDDGLWHKTYVNSAWTDWVPLGAVSTSDPAAVSWGSGRIDLFMRGTDNGLWHRWYDSGWSGWESLGGGLASGPAVASWGPGRLDVFVRGTDNALWTRHYDGGWSGWTSLGGVLTSDPAAVSWGTGRIDVFVRGTDNGLYTNSYGPNGWSGWTPLGGVLTSSPAVASQGVGKLDVFVRGTDNGLHRKSFNNGWGGWEALGGTLTSDPEAVSWGSGRVDVFARNSQNALSHTIPTAAQPAPQNQVPQTQVAKFFRAHDGSNKPQLSYGRGEGTSPTACPAGTEASGAFCYPTCSSGYYGVGPVCWESCPSGFTDTGALCTASGDLVVSRNTEGCPIYDLCGVFTSCGGGCPYGYANTGCTCTAQTFTKQSYGRGAGVAKVCASNLEMDPGGLCYPKCESGYDGVGPLCWLDQIGSNDVCAQLYDSTLANLATSTQQTMNYGFGVGIAANASVGVETGVAYGKGGEYGCYVSWCYGATSDVSISAWGSWGVSPLGFDSVEGPSSVTSVSASAGIAGASVGTVMSGGQYAGIVTSLSLGAGIAPISASYQNCETVVTQLW